jgi:UPF0755 protein
LDLKRPFFPAAVLAACFIVVVIASLALWTRSELETPFFSAAEQEIYIEIPKRASTNRIADMLVDAGVIRHKIPFLIYLRIRNLGRYVQAGEYRFVGKETPQRIAQRLLKGDVYFKSITIPEGLTADETIDLLVQNGLGERDELKQLLWKTDLIKDLNPNATNLEGYLFPETYRFGHSANSEIIIKALVDQFRKRIHKVLESQPHRPASEIPRIAIIASMIEKEVKTKEEGPLVASVFMNRLQRGMPLACDATIIYAMKLVGAYKGKLHRSDLVMHSPYNTYLNLELPPGPIANPGENALRAAINPAKTSFLYYVSRNDGTHQFSKNLQTHELAVNRYQRSGARHRPK